MKAKRQKQQKLKSFIRPDQQTSDTQATGFSDQEMLEILEEFWDEIAMYCHQQYQVYGRGVVVMERNADSDDHKIFYVTINMQQARDIDKKIVKLVKSYDPDQEIVFQYQCLDNNTRTMRVRTAEGARSPAQLWQLEDLLSVEFQG